MSNLAGKELLKPPGNKRPNRLEVFLQKYQGQGNARKFQLVAGGAAILKVTQSNVKMLKEAMKHLDDRAYAQKLDALCFVPDAPTQGPAKVATSRSIIMLKDLAKTSEFGGSPAGAGEDTERNESAQAVYCAARWKAGKAATEAVYSKSQLNDALSHVDISLQDTKKITETLPEPWQQSSSLIANTLYVKYSNKRYTFHRGSDWVAAIAKRFKKLNDDLGIVLPSKKFSNINKWTPADIWMVAKGAENKLELDKMNSLAELNFKLLECANSGDILGVSLKFTSATPQLKKMNFDKSKTPNVKFRALSVDGGFSGKADFFRNKAVDVEFSQDDDILYRTFLDQSNFAGEISGKDARHGKIGLGELSKFFHQIIPSLRAPEYREVQERWKTNKRRQFFTEFLKYAKKLSKDSTIANMDEKEFEKTASVKSKDWILSKYIGCYILYHLQTTSKGQSNMDEFVASCVLSASSQTELSAPFIKVGGA